MTFEEFHNEWNDHRDYITVKTSGSTGSPKEIELEKSFIKESALRTINFFDLQPGARFHSCVAADFIGGKMMAVRAYLAGGIFSWERPSNRPLEKINKSVEIDLLAVVPSQMLYILENYENLPKIRNIIIGGSAIHHSLRDKIAKSDLNAYETYGMTETASHIALRKIETEIVPFKTLEGIKIKASEEGTLVILFKKGKKITTNDLVEIISDTEFYIKGRKDDVIISGGRKLNLSVLEEKIRKVLTGDFMLTAFPDEKWGEKLVLLSENNSKEKRLPDLNKKLKKILQSWEMPKEIIFVDSLPLTANGKVRRVKDLSYFASVEPCKSRDV